MVRGAFERVSSIVRQSKSDDKDWRQVKYMIFELPNAAGSFEQRVRQIERIVQEVNKDYLVAVRQYRVRTRAALQHELDKLVAAGAERG